MRLLIVDDHPILRLGVRHLALSAFPDATIDDAETLEQAVARIRARRPTLIVLDLSLPDASGTEGPVRLLEEARGVPILVLSQDTESPFAARLLQLGVAGYLPKLRTSEELVTAMHRLLAGQRYVTPSMAEHLVGLLNGGAEDPPHLRLSAQEFRVMQLIAAGGTPARIAALMDISVKTVATYRSRILGKAGWANNTELTKYCIKHGLTGSA